MPNLYVARRVQRKGLLLKMDGTPQNPSLMFVMPERMERSELDELVRAQLQRQGITGESEVNAVMDAAEKQYEERIKTQETIKELRRLMAIRAAGGKLMQVGFRKWQQAFFPATKSFKKSG